MSSVTREQSTTLSEAGATLPRNCTSYLYGRKECALHGHCKHQDRERPNLCTTRGFLKDDAIAYRRSFVINSPANVNLVGVS